MKLEIGKECKNCLRIVTEDEIKAKHERKATNARRSSALAIANGNHHGGRAKVRDDVKIAELRRKGLSLREIAQTLNCSYSMAQRGVVEMKKADQSLSEFPAPKSEGQHDL